MDNRWGTGPSPHGDEVDGLVYLSRLIGSDRSLVQPGGGNSSIKLPSPPPGGGPWALPGETAESQAVLMVKGSGADLSTLGRKDLTHLSMARLAALGSHEEMTDRALVRFMGACMLAPHTDPLPSLETPLHAILPFRVIAHTHDVATLSLTNQEDDRAKQMLKTLYQDRVIHLPYMRPGFPLARVVADLVPRLSPRTCALALAHHGLVVWGETVHECHDRLVELISLAEQFLAERAKGRRVLGTPIEPPQSAARPTHQAEIILPVIRGVLGRSARVILRWEASDRVLDRLASPRFKELTQRGMATPEHLLRAGRLPLWIDLPPGNNQDETMASVRQQIEQQHQLYLDYHKRNAAGHVQPLPDWAKVLLIPGVGLVTAFKDSAGAAVAARCYGAVMEIMENAEAAGAFRFLPEEQVFAFEHWPLERQKVTAAVEQEKDRFLLAGQIALIIGAGSGIGAAAAWRFCQAGAHVVVADLDDQKAMELAAALNRRYPQRAAGTAVDALSEPSLAAAVRTAVLTFGGLDTLFYTAGRAPRFAPILEISRNDLESQLQVHYTGALLAIREAGRVLKRQGQGGSILCSVSKAALAPGREAAAYGGSKAALMQALRVAALELGPEQIRVNAINADQVETPLFMRFAAARAKAQGRSLEEQLEQYQRRNAMGVTRIPPEAVADLAVLLASDRFRFTTGDILTIDGGLPEAFPR